MIRPIKKVVKDMKKKLLKEIRAFDDQEAEAIYQVNID